MDTVVDFIYPSDAPVCREYNMNTWDWKFFTDSSGNHRWQRLSEDGSVLTESAVAFASCDACIEDASRHGYSLFHAPEPVHAKDAA